MHVVLPLTITLESIIIEAKAVIAVAPITALGVMAVLLAIISVF